MPNSEASNRQQAQNPASLPSSIDASPEPAPVDPAPLNGPQIANLGDGANGRLSEAMARHQNRGGDVRWSCDELDWIHWWRCACGYEIRTDEASALWFEDHVSNDVVAAVVREHTERALAEVEQRIDQCGVRNDSAERWGITTALHIVRDYRAARQEQS